MAGHADHNRVIETTAVGTGVPASGAKPNLAISMGRRGWSRAVPLVRRNLFADWRRLVLGIAGIGLALMLVLLLGGLWQGVKTQASLYPDHVGAQLFVTQSGVANFAGESSTLPLSTVAAVRATPGVRWAAPVRGQFVVFTLHAQKVAAYVVGYLPGRPGGPWSLAQGRAVHTASEVVVDQALARRHGLSVGDRLAVANKSFRIVGLSAGTSATMTGYVFISHAAADALLGTTGTTSYVLVGTRTPDVVKARLAGQGMSVFTSAQLANNDRDLTTGILGSPITLMIGVAFAAGVLIVALTVYTSVMERHREYGVVKALGATRGFLVGAVVRQALVLSLAGLAAGGILFVASRAALHTLRPQFSVVLTPGGVLRALVAAILMALVAAIVPARRVANSEPAVVYRGGVS